MIDSGVSQGVEKYNLISLASFLNIWHYAALTL